MKIFKSTRYHILCIFVLAFLVRLLLVWYLLGLDWRYKTGGYENAFFWKHILEGGCYMPPGQYLFAGLVNQFFPQPNYLLLRIAIILLSAFVSVNIYKIGKENINHTVGIITGYFSIISLTLIYQSWTFLSTTLAMCLFSLFILYFFRMLKLPKKKNIILAGVFLGLSALTRTEMLIFLPISFLWFLLVRGIGKNNFKSVFIMVLISLFVISFWTARNYLVCNRYILISSNGPINFFIGNNPIQNGRYLPPIASEGEKDNYLLSGLIYDLEHPGWFVEFFKEKFILYWSSCTREHPKQLLESRFDKSTVKLFNDSFEDSRLNKFIRNPRLDKFNEDMCFLYDCLLGVFWFFIFLGFIYGHLFWQKSYFLFGVCFVNAIVYSLFFPGANRYFVPMLPYLYIMMGIGINFIYKLPNLNREEVKTLLKRNSFIALIVFITYICSVFLINHPQGKQERIKGLHHWNILSIKEEFASLMLMESQLSYPVKKGSFKGQSLSVWIGEEEIPCLRLAGNKKNDEKFYPLKVKDFLCKNAIVINLPHTLIKSFSNNRKVNDGKVTAKEIINSLNNKIAVSYVPAWRFHGWIEKTMQYFLHLLQR